MIADTHHPPHFISYGRFLWRSLVLAADSSFTLYAWMPQLTAVALVGLNAWMHQVADGVIVTNMADHVSWGLYIANFTFMFGVAGLLGDDGDFP